MKEATDYHLRSNSFITRDFLAENPYKSDSPTASLREIPSPYYTLASEGIFLIRDGEDALVRLPFVARKQTDKKHYTCGGYGFEGRFVSYYYQLREVLRRTPDSVLEIGVGDGVFGSFIKNNTSIVYRSVDIAEDLHPDIIASITTLPIANRSFDIVCAFEVLEHLPFNEFDRALDELCRVARRYVVISLPHFGPMLSMSLKIPFLPQTRLAYKLPYLKTHTFNGEHYWEIGKKRYSISRIRERLRAHGPIVRDFIPFNSEYHHFFVLEVN
ncbi:MAG: class I SAM-dependent methyltransferase [Patescibacteria group bacterium]|nr:class I SAM-dependent methyltransferase [Patescibacteria group bacterium]